MDALEHSLLFLENLRNYTMWMWRKVRPVIAGKTLEIGSGTGNMTEYLVSKASEVVASDIEPQFVDYVGKRLKGRVRVVVDDITATRLLPSEADCFDAIVMVNVLEHIENDSVAVDNALSLLKHGGRMAIVVPAFRKLYGSIDERLGHLRRYEPRQLQRLLAGRGFVVERLSCMNLPGAFAWYVSGMILHRQYVPARQAMIYDCVVPLTSVLEAMLPGLPFGQSLVCFARKP